MSVSGRPAHGGGRQTAGGWVNQQVSLRPASSGKKLAVHHQTLWSGARLPAAFEREPQCPTGRHHRRWASAVPNKHGDTRRRVQQGPRRGQQDEFAGLRANRVPRPRARRVNWVAPRHSPSAPTLRASNRGSKTPRAMARWACKLWSCAWGSQASVIGLRRWCESIARLVGLPAGPRGPEDGLCPCCAVRRQLHEREQLLARQEG